MYFGGSSSRRRVLLDVGDSTVLGPETAARIEGSLEAFWPPPRNIEFRVLVDH